MDKGIYLHVCTNGTLIKKRLDAVKRAHVVYVDCVSCASINCIDTAMLLNFHIDIIFSGLRLHRRSAYRPSCRREVPCISTWSETLKIV